MASCSFLFKLYMSVSKKHYLISSTINFSIFIVGLHTLYIYFTEHEMCFKNFLIKQLKLYHRVVLRVSTSAYILSRIIFLQP